MCLIIGTDLFPVEHFQPALAEAEHLLWEELMESVDILQPASDSAILFLESQGNFFTEGKTVDEFCRFYRRYQKILERK